MIVFNNKSSPQKCQLHRVRPTLFLFFHNTIYYKPSPRAIELASRSKEYKSKITANSALQLKIKNIVA
jgi:hypothetical protein